MVLPSEEIRYGAFQEGLAMSGSGKPGATFKFTVISSKGTKATIQATQEEIAYLVPGHDYVGSFVSAPADDSAGSGQPPSDPHA